MKKFLAIALVLCMLLSSAVSVSAEEKYGVLATLPVSNCDEDAGFQNGAPTSEQKTEGAGSQMWNYAAGEVPFPSCMFTYNAAQPVDATGMNRFVFDFYVSDAAAIKDVPFHLELTSSGTCDQEEYQTTNTFAKLSLTRELVDGWNTCFIDIAGVAGCDFTRFNFFRFFQSEAFSTPNDLVLCIDNIRFENFVAEPAPVIDGVEVHQFTVFNANEEPYLLRTDAGNNGNQRFSDQTLETVYKFTVKNRFSVNKVTFEAPLGSQLLLQVSQDDANWTDLYVYEMDPNKPADQCLPNTLMSFDLTDKVDLAKCADIYIRIADVTTDNGWGGSIFKSDPTTLTVEYTPLSAADLDAIEAQSDENSIALLGFNKPHGNMTVDTEDYTAGSASNVFTLGNASGASFAPVDGTGMDTLTFDFYISDLALFDVEFGNTGLELTSSGGCDNSEISWKLADIRDCNIGAELKAGWNHVILPLETATPDDRAGNGPFDISAINFFRLFMVSPKGGDGIVVKIDNMRLDNSGIARAAEQLAKDTAAAEKVIKRINDIGEVTLDSERAIDQAEKAYKNLTNEQKALVTNSDVLKAAIETLEALIKAEEEKPEDPKPEDPQPEDPQPEDPQPEDPQPEEPEKKGCGKSITIGAGAMMLLAAAWVTMTARKKED